jgi:hypothetical protein
LQSAEMLRDKVVKRESKGDALKTFHDNFGWIVVSKYASGQRVAD